MVWLFRLPSISASVEARVSGGPREQPISGSIVDASEQVPAMPSVPVAGLPWYRRTCRQRLRYIVCAQAAHAWQIALHIRG